MKIRAENNFKYIISAEECPSRNPRRGFPINKRETEFEFK